MRFLFVSPSCRAHLLTLTFALVWQGYVSRQALYACVTCTTPATPSTGVCLACSYDCHDGHELVELYTKRWVVLPVVLIKKKEKQNVHIFHGIAMRGLHLPLELPAWPKFPMLFPFSCRVIGFSQETGQDFISSIPMFHQKNASCRNFRCDCGNSRMPDTKCKLFPVSCRHSRR